MPLLEWLKKYNGKYLEGQGVTEDVDDEEEQRRPEEEEEKKRDTSRPTNEEEQRQTDGTEFVYFATGTPNEDLTALLQTFNKDVKTFTDEAECVQYITPITNKAFLIVDGAPPPSLLEDIENLKQIDSVFIYSPSPDSIVLINQKQHSYLVNWCENEHILTATIQKSREELEQQTLVFSLYNKKEHPTHDISKKNGLFLFLQFKTILQNMPNSAEAKKTMVTTARNYYRGNLTELANIEDFDQNYKSVDAISWYTRETFVYTLTNKALRTQDVDLIYQVRFFIIDLSEQLRLKFLKLKKKQKDILKLYRGSKLSADEVENFQDSIGNLISTNGYLSTSSERSVAYGFATKSPKREGFVRCLFEYQVDLQSVQNIFIADIREYSAFPEEAEVVVDIGALFQIDYCRYSAEDDLWYIQVHATDQDAEYMKYLEKRMAESNIVLMFGNLLLQMDEYEKAERYFDTFINSSNPTLEEMACVFFYFGRTHRLKGDFIRAINCYNRAYCLHMNAKPKRSASAGKTLNGLGVVYNEQGRLLKAEECFQQAMKLYEKSISKKHVDVAGTLINLGTIDCDREDYDGAVAKYLKAKKIYDHALPPSHPNRGLLRVNLGNVYLATGQYELALEEYENGLKLQEPSLPGDHPDIARTLHNIELAKKYLECAEERAGRTLASEYPIMTLFGKTKNCMVEDV